MRKLMTVLATLVAALAVTGVAGAQDTADVTVVHGVPGLTVDVYVNGDLTLEGFEPGTVTDPIALPAGEYAIDIRAAGEPADSDPALSGAASVEGGASYSLVAHLDADGSPTLSAFVNDLSSIAAGDTRITVRHTAAAPAVDVLANDAPAITNLANPGEASVTIPAGTYTIAVAPAGTADAVLGPVDLTFAAGVATIVYAVGSAADGTLELLSQATEGLGEAPGGVATGDSGLASSGGFPVWAIALLGIAGLGAIASGFALARSRA